ncbi:ABC transporter permease [Hoeflea alexandrii]|uniref:ABC transporter permease n=1 Tax=Hoeflea alexandrii TaxID=288436 RepID=UPI0022B00E76|nr:ABC transporter permease [Hoeflea alexandrii]MCZ4288843.1 ABC transporter permease [Hoeflea alexandrii]
MTDMISVRAARARRLLALPRPGWLTVAAIVVLALIVLAGAFAPLLAPFEPTELNSMMRLKPADATHWMGTDSYGRDLFSRVLYGARISMIVGFSTALGSLAIGLPLGLIAGWFPLADGVLMRIMDGLMAIPGILLAIAVVALTKAGLVTVIIAIMLPEIPQVVRLVRARVISVRNEAYVEAARLLGTSSTRIIWRHLLPATFGPMIVQGTYIYAAAILTEAALSFLGVGIGTETPTWGNIMAEGRLYFALTPSLVFWPAVVLSFCILSINILGDALRDSLDPKMKARG